MPVHTDEAVNASILGSMLEGGTYRYDPVDRHGPTLYYATYPIARALGAGSMSGLEAPWLRLVPAVCGAALIASLLLFRSGVTDAGLRGAALWLGLGAPFVYYGRYWIHETLFVLITFLMLGSAWRYLGTGRRAWAVATGALAGLLLATKETAVLSLFCSVLALALTRALCPVRIEGDRRSISVDLALGLCTAVLAAAALFTSFGQNPHGALDALRSMGEATARAGGQGHEKPALAYVRWLFIPGLRSIPWCGWTLSLFGAAGAAAAWRSRRDAPLPVFLMLYAFFIGMAYSAIPYKTPWLELNALAPTAVVAGIGLCDLCGRAQRRAGWAAAAAIVAFCAVLLGSESRLLCFSYPADPGNPLAYSPTVPDAERLELRVEALLAGAHNPGAVVAVVGPDIWPLPWYLRHCPNVGYWAELPDSPAPAVVIAASAESERVAARLGTGWRAQIFGIRPEVLVVLYTRSEAGLP